ncbi:MAG: hypothetical protein EXQ96_06485 [Alphaproteobacteria bacterium]|nr:hypothetical protein [Alphaproteobacteria bacterium]
MRKRDTRSRGARLTPPTTTRAVFALVVATTICATIPAFSRDYVPIVPAPYPFRDSSLPARAVPWLEDIAAAGQKLGVGTLPAPHNLVLDSASAARRKFEASGFYLADVADGRDAVPRLFAARLPRDFHLPLDADARKDLFVRILLPLVLRVNEEILADRARLIDQLDALAFVGVSAQPMVEPEWLSDMRLRYGAAGETLDQVLVRVDAVPPSLALAQGAQESGWGRSRVAVVGNALFGQSSFSPSSSMASKRREKGGDYGVRRFDSVYGAVREYVMNLNTHPAYARFRQERAADRSRGYGLDGFRLAANLTRYAEDAAYVAQVRAIIRTNDLPRFDTARLHRHAAPLLVEFAF